MRLVVTQALIAQIKVFALMAAMAFLAILAAAIVAKPGTSFGVGHPMQGMRMTLVLALLTGVKVLACEASVAWRHFPCPGAGARSTVANVAVPFIQRGHELQFVLARCCHVKMPDFDLES